MTLHLKFITWIILLSLGHPLYSQQATRTLPNKPFSALGKWRGSFMTKQNVEIPFLFEVVKNKNGEQKVYFLNAEERFEAGDVQIVGDSLFIPLNQFDNELVFKIDSSILKGFFRKQDKSTEPWPIKAQRGGSSRFKNSGIPPNGTISGTYDIDFKNGDGTDEKAVGLFTQDGSKIRATFLRISGDSRYLEGIVEGNHFYLSSFIGGGPVLYKGSFSQDGRLIGEVTGLRGGETFTGSQNENAALPDPYKLTFLKDGYTAFNFSLPDLDGRTVSLTDEKYKGKVVIITITGTWCPNCIDEAAFLSPWYKQNKKRGVEAIAIHYERKADTGYVRKVVSRFSKKFDIQYTELFGGLADKQSVVSSLPALNTFLSFPTIIFIDKKGKVARIYTGFTGPATGKYYDQFVKEFNDEVDLLLKQ